VRDKDGTIQVGPGDAFLFQPGEAHQLWNSGDEDFVYYVIADNPRSGGTTVIPVITPTVENGR
jgi:mannose-6-phosphate isomerase-like protein (cupin superfamily)